MRTSQLIDKILALIVVLMLVVFTVYGQTPPPTGNEEGAPLDGFTTILLAFGVGYGVAKMYRKRVN
jgi:hypothetical protein